MHSDARDTLPTVAILFGYLLSAFGFGDIERSTEPTDSLVWPTIYFPFNSLDESLNFASVCRGESDRSYFVPLL